jgi:hypothetical protein
MVSGAALHTKSFSVPRTYFTALIFYISLRLARLACFLEKLMRDEADCYEMTTMVLHINSREKD